LRILKVQNLKPSGAKNFLKRSVSDILWKRCCS